MLHEIIYIATSVLSLAVIAVAGCFVRKMRNERPRKKRVLTSLHVFMAGAFVSTFIIFLPVYLFSYYEQTETAAIVRPFLLAFHNTMRVFILDGEFDTIKDAVGDLSFWPQTWFTFYSAGLYVLSPILTAGFILSMFKSVSAELRFRFSKKRPAFIFSEINDRSVALAKSIFDNNSEEKPHIVFAKVYDNTLEEQYENVTKAKEMGALLMPKEIIDIDFEKKEGRLELFFISDDESENLSHAVKIINGKYKSKKKKFRDKRYCERKNTKVFVFARSEGSARILDTLDKGSQYSEIDDKHFETREFLDDSELFKVRRVDDIQLLAWRSVENADIFSRYTEIDGEKVISVMLTGVGEYGIELFKTLVWYGQMKGYRLEINIIDRDKDVAKATLGHQCPDILKTNDAVVEGDSFYSIRFYDGIDIFTDQWDNAFDYSGDDPDLAERAQRLKRTTVAFVALGDDDRNIQAAVELRTLFDRTNGVRASADSSPDELPVIYSIVHDEEKADVLCSGCKNSAKTGVNDLKNHKKQPYNIHFIGSLPTQYTYDNVYLEELEKIAFTKCHMVWSYYSIDRMIESGEHSEEEISKIRAAERKIQIGNYESFEYFRVSSMTKAMHKRMIAANPELNAMFACKGDGTYDCDCENCWNRRRNEHNRWNAYTRSIGYVYGKNKADRAKIHSDLVPFDELDITVQLLD